VLTCGSSAPGQVPRRGPVSLVVDPADPVASSAPAQWAAGELESALTQGGYTVKRCGRIQDVNASGPVIMAAGIATPSVPESLSLAADRANRRILAGGSDPRGLVYALLELADRVRLAPATAFQIPSPVTERPANPVRSVMRQFTSEPLDKPWFHDREMWPRYLAMLATHRFNRFHLAFGLGYDSLQRVDDSYLLFLYPFLLGVPGYGVRATNLDDAERDRNLATLRFISEQTVARGLEFQLGVWMHGCQWPDSPRARHIIEGITGENHAPYCRDALTAVLKACPAISSVALRIHGESGIAEGSYEFWRTVFDGIRNCGRRVEIDLHAKGLDYRMIGHALATGMPVNVSPKYWAEHLGMPYHQAAIRDLEMPVAGHTGAGLMTLSEGSLVYTRYGYANFLRDDRKFTVRHRVFSGTQRLLLWGDPKSAAAYSRMFQFCGSTGADLMEPLTCRGRRGTGLPGATRTGYADARLEPRWDWEKYTYWYRVFGRALYNPDAAPEVFERQFSGRDGRALQSALANASRILPIVTTAHMPSAACDAYWPEVYWNHPMVAEARPNPYGDSPAPKTFQNSSPLDPQLFSRMSDCARELLGSGRTARYSPLEVARWLDDFAAAASRDLAIAGTVRPTDLSRAAIDVEIQIGLGRFFAAKFRGGVFYSMHEQTGDRRALEQALDFYRRARTAWTQLADRAKGVYAADLSAGDRFSVRGQWADRLAGMDQDIAAMEGRLTAAQLATDPRVNAAIEKALADPRRGPAPIRHTPPPGFRPKMPVPLEITVEHGGTPWAARLYYRHVNQAERFEAVEMEAHDNTCRASIPGDYTDSAYPLQYYFELQEGPDRARLFPGFAADLLNLPYFVLRRAG